MAGKGDASNPSWQYIAAALTRGRALARSKGFQWNGDSCFLANAVALFLVMATRQGRTTFNGDGQPTLKTDNPQSLELAYADHYLQARMVASFSGAAGAVSTGVARYVYDSIKEFAADLQDAGQARMPELLPDPTNPASLMPDAVKLGMAIRAIYGSMVGPIGDRLAKSLQESSAHLSRPTAENIYWVDQGSADGRGDYQIGDLMAQYRALKDLFPPSRP